MDRLAGMSQPTTLFLLVEARLGESLIEWIAARRPNTSWRLIAREIWDTTGVDVTHETVRIWGGGADSSESAA